MIYGSVCSGHCAATQAWIPLGWTPAFFAEVEAFPCGVLAHRFRAGRPRHYLDPAEMPTKAEVDQWTANNKELDRMVERGEFGNGTPNLGDFTRIDPSEWPHVEWLIGGTPCQDFSIAGGRIGLAGHRGNLALAFIGLAHDLASTGSLRGATWENVPGVLSDRKNAFGCFLGTLVGHDAPIVSPHRKGRWTDAGVVVGPRARAAWRVLDAQHFGLAQRRRRLFVVVCFGDGPDPVEILFERQGVPGIASPRVGARQDVAGTVTSGTGVCRPGGAGRGLLVAGTLTGGGRGAGGYSHDDVPMVPVSFPPETAHTLRADGFDASEDGTERGTPLVPMAFGGNNQSGPIDVATARSAHAGPHGRIDFETETFIVEPVAKTVIAHGDKGANPLDETLVASAKPKLFSAMPMNSGRDFTVREVAAAQCHPLTAEGHAPAVAIPILESGKRTGTSTTSRKAGGGMGEEGDPMFTLGTDSRHAVAFSLRGRGGENEIEAEPGNVAPALRTGEGGSSKAFVATGITWAVRRLMPRECERLQGTEDDFTLIPWRGHPAEECPDGPRYKVIGNSMATNVVRWLGQRIEAACAPKAE